MRSLPLTLTLTLTDFYPLNVLSSINHKYKTLTKSWLAIANFVGYCNISATTNTAFSDFGQNIDSDRLEPPSTPTVTVRVNKQNNSTLIAFLFRKCIKIIWTSRVPYVRIAKIWAKLFRHNNARFLRYFPYTIYSIYYIRIRRLAHANGRLWRHWLKYGTFTLCFVNWIMLITWKFECSNKKTYFTDLNKFSFRFM